MYLNVQSDNGSLTDGASRYVYRQLYIDPNETRSCFAAMEHTLHGKPRGFEGPPSPFTTTKHDERGGIRRC